MLDFVEITHRSKGKPDSGDKSSIEVYPVFQTIKHKDLMVRGGAFYAVWDPEVELWCTDEIRVQQLVDKELRAYSRKLQEENAAVVTTKWMRTLTWSTFRLFLSKLPDNYRQLDEEIAFANTKVQREQYVSKRLPYPLEPGDTPAFDDLFGTLYDEENLTKIMWAIGSIFSGDSRFIQKFYVLYGLPGTGKSTVLNLISKLFSGYTTTFEASALTKGSSAFALEPFRDNPLVGIDHEGDLSRINTNSVLTSLVSHDVLPMNVKYRSIFEMRPNSTLFIATNKPVMITDTGSGLLRRLIDIQPTGIIVPPREYDSLIGQIDFELGAIAHRCLSLYKQLGKDHYIRYNPVIMMQKTNHLYNFIHEHSMMFENEGMVTLKRAWELYKEYCEEIGLTYRLNMNTFREQMRDYWEEFFEMKRIGTSVYRSLFMGFKTDVFNRTYRVLQGDTTTYDWLEMDQVPSVFDRENADQPAQLANQDGLPNYKWENVNTKLKDIDTSKLHYVLPRENLITIDFDLKDKDGHKSLALNKEAARKFPHTYAELSKGGQGIHLHYYYDGDISELSRIYDVDIEILRPVGNFSIRRRLSVCNDQPIATINSGLPTKPSRGDTMVSDKTLSNERALRKLILRNLHKEIHPATKPSIDFIDLILNESYENGLRYDVTDMKPAILNFASNSTNNAEYCIKLALNMKYQSDHEDPEEGEAEGAMVFYDVEVYPNLLLVCWKQEGSETVVQMVNPTAEEIGNLLNFRLIGFNNRRYDNHILYARYLGYDNQHIYNLSKRIVSGDRTAFFREAYSISYADVYDFASKKQSLKHWQVELGLLHYELDIPWDEDVDERLFDQIGEYCSNDVRSTESVYYARIEDFHARLILSEISGLTPNDPTLSQAARIIFGKNRNPQSEFVYPKLAETFPGYTFDKGESKYRGEIVGEGGYVYAEPGMYTDVVYLDVASMHPTSLEQMNLFGKYTQKYSDLKHARILIKEGKLDEAGQMFGGVLAKYLADPSEARGLSYALKIILNSVYGFTAARFSNPFRDVRNKDNVVAKRGALFMVDLKHALWDRGCKPIHFKTDSVKIANFTPEDIEFVVEFGKKYGYDFEIEGVYSKLVLINDAVLIGQWKDSGTWDPVGARFAHPYVFKSIFSKEPIEFEDMIETRSVQKGSIYIESEDGTMSFVGRIGQFCPMRSGGGILYRVQDENKYAVTGTKGYSWMRADVVRELGREGDIDKSYFDALVEEALTKISEFGDLTMFLGE